MKRMYVPILKWKTGEQIALENLREDQKLLIFPLLELIDEVKATEIIESLTPHLNHYPLYIDTVHFEDKSGEMLIELIESLEETEHAIYPVLYPNDFPDFSNEFIDLTNKVLVRIPISEDTANEDYTSMFLEIIKWQRKHDIEVDVFFDMGLIVDKDTKKSKCKKLEQVLRAQILTKSEYKSIIIASNSFPERLDSLASGDDLFVDRYEVDTFSEIFNNTIFSQLKNRLLFSDYGVSKFTNTELDFSKMRYGPLPKARYTLDKQYWILKGAKNRKTNQWIRGAKTLAEDIYNSKHYYGDLFSFGDKDIKERALNLNNKGPGNSTNWVTIAANHHIAVVLEQLSNLDDS